MIRIHSFLIGRFQAYVLEENAFQSSFEKEFILTKNRNDRFGFETYIDLEGLEKGKHLVRVIGPANKKQKGSKTEIDTLKTIPFWYFPENREPSNVQNTSTQLDSITSN